MKQNIYYGNIVSSNITTPSTRPISSINEYSITFTGFDLSDVSSLDQKLDLLFYNRVNEIGEILSSLVYISNPVDIDDVSEKIYDVSKLYANTNAELSLQITSSLTDFTYLNCKWLTSKYFVASISPMSDTEHEELAANGNPSVKIEKYGISFDGWYSQMSVGLYTSDALVATPESNLLAMHTFGDLGKVPAILLVTDPDDISLDNNWNYI